MIVQEYQPKNIFYAACVAAQTYIHTYIRTQTVSVTRIYIQ